MKRLFVVSAALMMMFALVGRVSAATVVSNDSSSSILYASEAASRDANTGISSFLFAPGTTTKFRYPANDGSGDYFIITISGTQTQKSFNSLITGWTYTFARYTSYGVHIWTWKHYTEWGYNGQCITQKLSNTAWSAYNSPGWDYPGNTTYYIFTINPACYPLGILWSGRQGHYYNWVFHQDDYPWELGEAYATGYYRTYDHGCSGAC